MRTVWLEHEAERDDRERGCHATPLSDRMSSGVPIIRENVASAHASLRRRLGLWGGVEASISYTIHHSSADASLALVFMFLAQDIRPPKVEQIRCSSTVISQIGTRGGKKDKTEQVAGGG